MNKFNNNQRIMGFEMNFFNLFANQELYTKLWVVQLLIDQKINLLNYKEKA